VPGYAYNFVTNSYTDTARTIRAVSGDACAAFDDLSGNGHHIGQATASKRAVLGTSAGFLSLQPDGVDDSYETPSSINLPLNQATIFYALRHIASAPMGILAEASTNLNANVNGFGQYLNDGGIPGGISMSSKGTLFDYTTNGSGSTTIPRTISVSVALDGTKATAAERLIPRVNGAVVSPSFVYSAGNPPSYGNHVHYFFARAGTSFFAASRCVGITVVGKLCSQAEIAAMERYYGRLCGLSF
jgi:hypothetical protein